MESAGKRATRPPDYLRSEIEKSDKKGRTMSTTTSCTTSTSSTTTTMSSNLIPTLVATSNTTSSPSSDPARPTDNQFALIHNMFLKFEATLKNMQAESNA